MGSLKICNLSVDVEDMGKAVGLMKFQDKVFNHMIIEKRMNINNEMTKAIINECKGYAQCLHQLGCITQREQEMIISWMEGMLK